MNCRDGVNLLFELALQFWYRSRIHRARWRLDGFCPGSADGKLRKQRTPTHTPEGK